LELAVKNLTKCFRVNQSEHAAFEAVDFTVDAARFVSIVGPSGCGKSTLLRCIAGFEKPSAGTVLVDGKPVLTPSKDRMVVFQSFDQLFPWMTILKNITYALRVTRTAPPQSHLTLARQYLDLVGLNGYGEYYPHQLSGGMKQRAAIARALAVRPQILLMDEPFGSLDALTRSKLQDELIQIWEKTHLTIVFVTHSIEESILLSDEIIIFEGQPGRIKTIVTNPLPRPRSPENPGFAELWQKLNSYLGLPQKETTPSPPRQIVIINEPEIYQPTYAKTQ